MFINLRSIRLTRYLIHFLLMTSLLSLTALTAAQTEATNEPDQILVDVVMTEGTNMAAAVSPNGEQLVLAIQGTLWLLPIDGGEALKLTPPELDAQEPAWSPDGNHIAFYGFANDKFSVWMVRSDGSQLREMSNGIGDARYPSFSPDGSTLYYSSDAGNGYALWGLDLISGERQALHDASATGYEIPAGPYFSGSGNAVYPIMSPHGGQMAFVIDGELDRLVLWDLEEPFTYSELLSAPILSAPSWSADGEHLYIVALESDSAQLLSVAADGSAADALVEGGDIFPFRPDLDADGYIVYTADGGVQRVSSDGERGRGVEFSAQVTLDRTPYQRRSYDFTDQTPRKPLGIIDPILSPDARRAAYSALGDLWLVDLPDGDPINLTDDAYIAMSPSWSPDGSRIAFVSDRNGKADIWLMELATGETTRVTDRPRPANSPIWSHDGNQIAFLEDVGNSIFISATLNILDLDSGEVEMISDPVFGPSAPSWSPDDSTLAFYYRKPMTSRFREGLNVIRVLAADGSGEVGLVSPVAGKSLGRRQFNRPAWSAQGELVYRIDGALWLTNMSPEGELSGKGRMIAMGENPSWSADGSRLIYLDGAEMMYFDRGNDTIEALDIKPDWAQYLPESSMTVRAGLLFDGSGELYLENQDIFIENGVIQAVVDAGSRETVGEFIDASSQFVMPGLIEGHTHQSITQGIELGEQYLCHAITSVRETADDPYHAVARREIAASGRAPGPRVFTAGPLNEGARVSYGVSETVGTLAAVEESARLSSALELDLYKSYVRQDYAMQKRAIELAHEAGIPVSSHELYPAVANGVDQMEHLGATSRRGFSLKMSRFNIAYQDVISLINDSGVVVIPTIAMSERPDRDISPMTDTLLRIVEGGGRIMAGTDSPFVPHAAALHRELEIYVEAGLTPATALRAASSEAAEAIGAGSQLGRIAPGYIADIAIFDGNLFESIYDIRNVHTVIKTGELVCSNQ